MIEPERAMPVINGAPAALYERKILRLAVLAPVIQHSILTAVSRQA